MKKLTVDYGVFLSHSNYLADKTINKKTKKSLKNMGIQVYVAEHDLQSGHLGKKIKEGIEKSDCVVAVWTKKASSSRDVNQEIGFAEGLGKDVIMLVEDDAPKAVFHGGHEHIPLDGRNPELALTQLRKLLKTKISTKKNFKKTQPILLNSKILDSKEVIRLANNFLKGQKSVKAFWGAHPYDKDIQRYFKGIMKKGRKIQRLIGLSHISKEELLDHAKSMKKYIENGHYSIYLTSSLNHDGLMTDKKLLLLPYGTMTDEEKYMSMQSSDETTLRFFNEFFNIATGGAIQNEAYLNQETLGGIKKDEKEIANRIQTIFSKLKKQYVIVDKTELIDYCREIRNNAKTECYLTWCGKYSQFKRSAVIKYFNEEIELLKENPQLKLIRLINAKTGSISKEQLRIHHEKMDSVHKKDRYAYWETDMKNYELVYGDYYDKGIQHRGLIILLHSENNIPLRGLYFDSKFGADQKDMVMTMKKMFEEELIRAQKKHKKNYSH